MILLDCIVSMSMSEWSTFCDTINPRRGGGGRVSHVENSRLVEFSFGAESLFKLFNKS